MMTSSEFADALGRAEIAKATGVGLTAVSNAVVRGWFPPRWFAAVKTLADAQGVECPVELFRMRFGTHSQYVETKKVNGQEIQTGGAA